MSADETSNGKSLAAAIQAVRRRYFVHIYHPITLKILVAFVCLGLLLTIVSSASGRVALDGIHQALRDQLLASIVFLALLFLVATLSPSFPEFMIIVMSGFVFGVWVGGVFSIVCVIIAASANFSIARRSKRRIPEYLFDKHSVRELRWTARRITPAMVFLTWFLPSINFDLISYAAGMSRMKFRTFAFLTIVGTLFSTFLLAFLGDRLRSSEASTVVALLLIYTFAGILLYVKDVPPWFSEFGSDDDEPLAEDAGT